MSRRVLVSPRPREPQISEPLRSWFTRCLTEWTNNVFEQFRSIIKYLPDHEITPAEVSAGVTPTSFQYPELDINRYGPDGTVAGDTLAFQKARDVVDALGAGQVDLDDATTYYLGEVGELPYGIHFRGKGPGTVLMKSTASAVFTVKVFHTRFSDMKFDADVGTSSTYGTSGCMIDHVTGFTSAFGRLVNIEADNIDALIRFAGDAGYGHEVIGGYWQAETLTAGSEGQPYKTGYGSDDTGAMFRRITSLNVIGEIDLSGASDSNVTATDCRRIKSSATTTLLTVTGGRWGSLGAAVSINGIGTRIMGAAISGNVTLEAGMSGSCVFVGNTQSSGTFTDNSPAGVCLVIHRPLSVGYININKQTITQSNNTEEVQTRRVGANSGDAATTLTLDQSQTIVMYGTPLTADRAVNLPATGRNGFTFRVVRNANCTGAFNVNVGTGPLKALAAASTWCEVTWSTPAAAWILTAAGTL